MPPPSRIGMVVLHVGSNDASRTRKDIQIYDYIRNLIDRLFFRELMAEMFS